MLHEVQLFPQIKIWKMQHIFVFCHYYSDTSEGNTVQPVVFRNYLHGCQCLWKSKFELRWEYLLSGQLVFVQSTNLTFIKGWWIKKGHESHISVFCRSCGKSHNNGHIIYSSSWWRQHNAVYMLFFNRDWSDSRGSWMKLNKIWWARPSVQ